MSVLQKKISEEFKSEIKEHFTEVSSRQAESKAGSVAHVKRA
jgi:hypothetical protein